MTTSRNRVRGAARATTRQMGPRVGAAKRVPMATRRGRGTGSRVPRAACPPVRPPRTARADKPPVAPHLLRSAPKTPRRGYAALDRRSPVPRSRLQFASSRLTPTRDRQWSSHARPSSPSRTRPPSARSPCPTRTPTRSSSPPNTPPSRSEEHTSELQSHVNLVCRLLLEKKNQLQKVKRQRAVMPQL